MTRVARCRKKPVDLCDLAKEEEWIELVELADHGCKNENCGLYFVDDPNLEPLGADSPDLREDKFKAFTGRIGTLASGPAFRIGGMLVVIVGIAVFLMPEEVPINGSNYDQDLTMQSCGELPPVPVDGNVPPERSAFAAIKANTVQYITCGAGLQVVGWLREAAEQGDGEASLALGDAYNPNLRSVEKGLVRSSQRAYSYYRKAYGAGADGAACRLQDLKTFVLKDVDKGNVEANSLISVWKDVAENRDCT